MKCLVKTGTIVDVVFNIYSIFHALNYSYNNVQISHNDNFTSFRLYKSKIKLTFVVRLRSRISLQQYSSNFSLLRTRMKIHFRIRTRLTYRSYIVIENHRYRTDTTDTEKSIETRYKYHCRIYWI